MALDLIAASLKRTFPGLQKWAYNFSGFNQYGLHRDDIIHVTPEVEEALKRLPKHVLEERTFRIIRAQQLNCRGEVLPKEQWTKLEEDQFYLQPVLEELRKERKEREAWNAE